MDTAEKIFPAAHPEVAKMFHLDAGQTQDSNTVGKSAPGPLDLPILEAEAKEIAPDVSSTPVQSNRPVVPRPPSASGSSSLEQAKTIPQIPKKQLKALVIGKTVLPYVAVFIVGLVLYYFYFSTFSFSTLFKSASDSVPKTPQTSALTQLENANSPQFLAWMNQFYFQVNDQSLLDPENDNSGNGLTNFQKFLLKLNPKAYDSLNLGMGDGQAIVQGIDPLTGQQLTGDRKQIVDNYFDLEGISNRITLGALNGSNQAHAAASEIGARNSGASSAGTTSSAQPQGQIGTAATTGVPKVAGATAVDINTGIPGSLDLPSLKLSTPIIWTSDIKNIDGDLTKGVIHYPGTALPGEIGTSYISGHSSNYPWAKGNYNRIFSHLDQLTAGTSFTITITTNSNQKVILHYVVDRSQQFAANDQAQFENTADSVVALSTCWPVNTTAKRLVVFAKLTQVER